MTRLVLVHGSVGNGLSAWSEQVELGDARELLVVNRPGFPPGPLVDHVDFEEHADWLVDQLRAGDHLCGHSYGGVVSLVATGKFPELSSLTVIEPPAFGLAAGNPDVDALVTAAQNHWATCEREPHAFLTGFYRCITGRDVDLPNPLPADVEQGARTLMVERGPWEAQPPLAAIADTGLPTLVVSGGWSPAFDAVCHELVSALGSEYAVHPGAGHNAQAAPGFNDTLTAFLDRVESGRCDQIGRAHV